jgi:hypothetical protein
MNSTPGSCPELSVCLPVCLSFLPIPWAVSCMNDIINSPVPLPFVPSTPFTNFFGASSISTPSIYLSIRSDQISGPARPSTCLDDLLSPPIQSPPASHRPQNNVAGEHIGEHDLQQGPRAPAVEHHWRSVHRQVRVHLRLLPKGNKDCGESEKGNSDPSGNSPDDQLTIPACCYTYQE